MSDTLHLNACGNPISSFPVSTISWQRAVKLYFLNKVDILTSYEDKYLNSPSFSMQVPAVVMTKYYYRPKYSVAFNRQTLALRDEFNCQYCGDNFRIDDLTIDHVLPRSIGGKSTWDNCVIACKSCNVAKGSKLLSPRRKPEAPDYYRMAALRSRFPFTVRHASWLDYLPNGQLIDPVPLSQTA